MISSPATPTVCLEQKSENFQSRNVTLSMPSQSKNNCIWDNLQCCLLVPRSPSKPLMMTLTCNLEKCNSLRSSFGMYNLERQLRYWHLLTRHCPCNFLPEPTAPKHEYREKLWRHRWRHHHKKLFWHNLGRSFHIRGQIEAVFNISKWPPFWARDKLFYRQLYRKLNIPEI